MLVVGLFGWLVVLWVLWLCLLFFVFVFVKMVGAGIPELLMEKDIDYLTNKFHLKFSLAKAEKHFEKEVTRALNDKTRRVDAQFHMYKHA